MEYELENDDMNENSLDGEIHIAQIMPAKIDDALYDLNVKIIESLIDLSLKIGTEDNSHEIAEYVMNVNFYISRAKKIIESFYANE